ncbi:MAG: hypothetical protein WCT77_14010 [Bacteroidota bacterium]|jgi:hypothetical protein
MINENIFTAFINSTGSKGAPRYNRLRIPKDTKELIESILKYKLNEIIIKYHSENVVASLKNLLFSKYGEIDHDKFKDWSGNKHSRITLNLLNLKNGIIEISEIY